MFTPRIHSNCSPNASGYQEKALPIFIHIHHWIVSAIGVSVESLSGEGVLHLWVRREEAAKHRVVEAGIHVDDAEAVIMLMAGKATTESEASAILRQSPIGGTHAVAPWVKMATLHDIPIAVHNALPASEQVGLHVVDAVGIGGGIMYM